MHDLAGKTRIANRRIESFENSLCHLYAWENDELINVFKKAGIIFLSDFEVRLSDDANINKTAMVIQEGQHITITAEDLNNEDPSKVYVATDNYVGPDRRERKEGEPPKGQDRRGTKGKPVT